jgi:hypothetical protein
MASFTDLCSDVYTVTNRPDLIAETKLAVKQATLKLHQVDYFPKDLVETGIAWTPAAFIQSLAYRTLIPRWRSFKYLRKYSDQTPGEFFSLLSPDETLDRYGINRENICYLAGDQLEIRSNTEDTHMLLSCYVHPDITETGFTSWIAIEHPYAIVYEAAASIFKMIGFDEQAAYMKQNVTEQVALLRQNQIIG